MCWTDNGPQAKHDLEEIIEQKVIMIASDHGLKLNEEVMSGISERPRHAEVLIGG